MMMKIFVAICLIVAYAQCSKLSDDVLDTLIKKYEDQKRGAEDLDPRFCGDTPYECYRCEECHDHLQFGLCIKGARHSRCLCKWGFTGANARRVPDIGLSEWSSNRVRADDCKTPCHYTHDFWKKECASGCDDYHCELHNGVCINGKCEIKYEEKKRGADDLDPRFCGHTPYKCKRCSECHDHLQFGLCIIGASHAKCLCKWGFTGANAERVPDAGVSEWSRNRVRADDCKTHCHYTHDYWSSQCAGGCNEIECALKNGKCVDDTCVKCDEYECKKKYGKCIKGECVKTCDEYKCKQAGGKCIEGVCKFKCCRNALNSVQPYSSGNFKDYCEDRCKYVEMKPGACPFPHITPPCNPKCKLTGGKCNPLTGRCECCKDFTGPHAKFIDGIMTATHCGVWCPHLTHNNMPNLLCVNHDYIERAEKNQ